MSVVLVGIDEAGYGPMLGPLCIGMAAISVDDWSPGQPAPDLWSLLRSAVCRKPSDAQGRVAVEDSKRLKLGNDTGAGWAALIDAAGDSVSAADRARHPLVHLERGVLAFVRTLGAAPASDEELLATLGAGVPSALAPWYGGPPIALPIAGPAAAGAQAIDANRLAGALASAGAAVLALRCRAVPEAEFNAEVRRSRSKATTTALGLAEHLAEAWRRWGADDADGTRAVRIVLDRQGGRTDYAGFLAGLLPATVARGVSVATLDESPTLCRYEITGAGLDGRPRRMTVLVRPEAESAYLPVALASMAAKLTRELLMARLNRCFITRARAAGIAEPKPTAGYVTDARRWLREARPLLTDREREGLVRIA